jgi:alpha-galactosidase/6-phospho-beta-glucosidase family protein
MPLGVAQLLQHEAAVQALVVEAALTGDYDTGVQAIMQDGTVPSVAMARAIMDEMLRLQKDLLPQFNQRQ